MHSQINQQKNYSMKAKTLLLALVASLFIFSGCSKDDDDSFSLADEFQKAIKFRGADYAKTVQQLQSEGYVLDAEEGVDYYAKIDLQTSDTFYYRLTKNVNTVTAVEFGVKNHKNFQSEVTNAENYVGLIKLLNKEYHPSGQENFFLFNHVTYIDADGRTNKIEKFEDFLTQLGVIAGYDSNAIWDYTAGDDRIEVARDPIKANRTYFRIGKFN